MNTLFPSLDHEALSEPAVYFASDTHLHEDHPEIADAFCRFLQTIRPTAKALYLLGDVFEAWIGDDHLTPFNQRIIDELKRSSDTHPCFLLPGNRDILMGKRFYRMTGCQAIPDEHVIDLYGERCLLSHGDRYCLADLGHQRYRRITQQRWLCRLVASLPLKWRVHIAKAMRKQSQKHQSGLQLYTMDVTQDAIVNALETHQCTTLIHGHTHQASIHDITCKTHKAQRIVLGDWEGDKAIILRVSASDKSLVSFSITAD